MYDNLNSVLRSWRPEKYILLRHVSEFNTSFFPSVVSGLYDAAIMHHDHKLSEKYDADRKFVYVDEMIDMSRLKNDSQDQFQILKD